MLSPTEDTVSSPSDPIDHLHDSPLQKTPTNTGLFHSEPGNNDHQSTSPTPEDTIWHRSSSPTDMGDDERLNCPGQAATGTPNDEASMTHMGMSTSALPSISTVCRCRSKPIRTKTILTPTSGGGTALVGDLTAQIETKPSHAIAHGGFSDVFQGIWRYEAQNEDGNVNIENQKVAIKLLRALTRQQFDLERAKKRLNRELYVWHRLDHPNIARFQGISFHLGGRPSMVMDWYPNGSILQYLKNKPDIDKMPLVLDISRGLEYLHTLNPPIVHGDLKCNNVLVTDEGQAVLSDFGLSQVVEYLVGPTGNTTTNIAGTIRWQAPELLMDESESDTLPLTLESDVWSFGCTTYELLSERIPYSYRTHDWTVVQDITSGALPGKPEDLNEDEKGWIWRLLCDCWSYDSQDRPHIAKVVSQIENYVRQVSMLQST